jgi:hypothetical protein
MKQLTGNDKHKFRKKRKNLFETKGKRYRIL